METVFDDFKDRSFNLNRTYDIELFKAFVNVDMNLNDWSLDFDESLFEFNDVEPHINLKLVNFTCNFTGDFDLHTEPAFYIDKGPAHIYVAPMLVDVGFGLQQINGTYQLVMEKSNMTYNGMDI